MAYSLGIGMSFPFIEPARVALIARVVPKKSLVNAFALNGLAQNASRLAFPFIGGVLIAFFGPGETLLVAAVMFAAIGGVALSITRHTAARTVTERRSAVQEVKETVRYVRGQPVVMGILMIGVLLPVMYVPSVNRMMPVYAAEVFTVGPAGLGLLTAARFAGGAIGVVVLAALGVVQRRGILLLGVLTLFGIGQVFLGQAWNLWMALLFVTLTNMMAAASDVLHQSLLQLSVPNQQRGRAMGSWIVGIGFAPWGQLQIGYISDITNSRAALLINGSALVIVAMVMGLVLLVVDALGLNTNWGL